MSELWSDTLFWSGNSLSGHRQRRRVDHLRADEGPEGLRPTHSGGQGGGSAGERHWQRQCEHGQLQQGRQDGGEAGASRGQTRGRGVEQAAKAIIAKAQAELARKLEDAEARVAAERFALLHHVRLTQRCDTFRRTQRKVFQSYTIAFAFADSAP